MARRIDITISNDNLIFLRYLREKYGVCASELINNLLDQLRSGRLEEDEESIVIRFLGLVIATSFQFYSRSSVFVWLLHPLPRSLEIGSRR